ncbi:uncharacterized protein At4g06598-like [Andrographis paniculata]|uniref:uncharacterized protein At4g06598-like n=1 Tax=Andrographis paniculata TaxID=175694 RepID=UPI0021E95738|nr:uncharacterized protein At4g06598-like [Andrographis paniculata]
MESTNGLLKSPALCASFHPFSFSRDSSSIESTEDFQYGEYTNYHQRCSSESFLFDEQPPWLDELLKDPESPSLRVHHRRSASDSFAYLEEAAETFNECEESKYRFADFRAPAVSNNLLKYKDACNLSTESKATPFFEKISQEPEEVDHSRAESSPQNLEGSADKDAGSQARPAGPKLDSKRKQHNAHRSRVRKLQYIAHLEKTVDMLKVEGTGISAELEFLEQQNMILTMENRALRQRLESVSQEQIIKQWEQGMLEREIARLQSLHYLQKQQQMHMHQQPKHRRNKSRDLDHQSNSSSMKNNDASSSKGSVNDSAQA